MNNIFKTCYVDNRFRTLDSVSDSDSTIELKEQLDLPGNTVCCVNDISIPHTWRTIESHNNEFYIILKTECINGSETTYNCIPYVLNIQEGNCSGSNLVTAIQELLTSLDANFVFFDVMYNPARGTVNIEATSDGIHAKHEFLVPSAFGTMNWMSNTDSDCPWRNIDGTMEAVDITTIQCINGVLRNTQMIHHHQLSYYYN